MIEYNFFHTIQNNFSLIICACTSHISHIIATGDLIITTGAKASFHFILDNFDKKVKDTHAHTPSPDRALCPAFLSEHQVALPPVDETVPTESAAHSQTLLYTTDRKTKWIETLVSAD